MPVTMSPSLIEGSEAEALFAFETGPSADVRAELGAEATRVGDAVVLAVRDDPAQFWSKALGFGRTEPVTAGQIAEVCAFYRARGIRRALLQLAPSVLPEDWDEIRDREGITDGASWVKVVGAVDEVLARADAPERRRPDGIRTEAVAVEDAERWADVMSRAFGLPANPLVAMAAATVGGPAWHGYSVLRGEEIVGTGTMHRSGTTAQFFGGAVLPEARNRGGQTELLVARARAAARDGATVLVAETGAEMEGTHNSSLHNMLRLGFQVAYERHNWLWELKD
ncbi:GNAT family N-acetyltransferase [Streptomyces sp. J2-1]|uniref:GNAT family N-acetyltransferase n=1 Tax=Streptomyces corallincola TaxID=2851888 RepID=UPI001C38C010|nr:GNAT family N-acetyltransferase [Streptomyces corallincola]MBV2357592.1 GNAT family N-acetyltransferase [Streptomyces corallincola]